ncbi:MAG: DUF5916 domain-containing protein [Acidobacteriota bacterium]
MKYLPAIVALLAIAAPVDAQKINSSSSASSSSAKASAVSLPPEKAQPIRIPLTSKAPVIDGKLDDETWKSAAVLKDFYQTHPGDNIAPSHPTEVMLTFDARHLYIAFRAYDEAGKVRATTAARDDVFSDDTVQIMLDTFNDRRKAYTLIFNPFGIQADGIRTEGAGEDYSVDIVMESKGILTDNGYTVEVAIPFKSLRYEAGAGKLWGVHVFRRITRLDNENNSWMPVSRDKTGLLNQSGHITGLEGIATERSLEIIPTITFSQSGRRVATLPPDSPASLIDPGRFVNSPVKIDPGISVKFGITPNVTLDFAANPDFAQVEADAPVVVANQRFPIFFGEKRPFFLEGIDIFRTPIQTVHTRTIIDPDYAVKLTGKQGRNSFGLLLASDNAPGDFSEEEINDPDVFPSIAKFIDKNAYVGVLRLKRDVGKESSLGVIATSYNFIERHNQLGGIDGRLKLDQQTTLSFQAVGTTSRRSFFDVDRAEDIYRTGNGFAYTWSFDKSGRNFGYNLRGSGRTEDYRADVGFTPRTNTNSYGWFVRYNTDPKPKAKLISWRLFNFTNTNFDWQGRMTDLITEGSGGLSFARNTGMGGGVARGYQRIFEEEFGARRNATRSGTFFGDAERSSAWTSFFAWFETNPTDKLEAWVNMNRAWSVFDFDFGAGLRYPRVSPAALRDPDSPLDPGVANSLGVGGGISYKWSKDLSTSVRYSRDTLHRRDTNRTVFVSNIYSTTTTYQFTRFSFARARIDYDTLSSGVRGQFLAGWTPNPGTAFYAGYNDNLNYNGFNPFTSHPERGFHRNSRVFFVKMSYLFRRSF